MGISEGFIEALITGVISGVVASVIFWFGLSRVLVPKWKVSAKIAKTRAMASPGTFFYQLKIQNDSKRWALIDVNIEIRLGLPNISGNDITNTYVIGPSNWKVAAISKGGKTGTGYRVTIPHRTTESRDTLSRPELRPILGELPTDRSFELEQLLPIEEAFIRVTLTCKHPVFGSSGFIRKKYYLRDIVEGRFSKHSCDIRTYDGDGLELEQPAAEYYGTRDA